MSTQYIKAIHHALNGEWDAAHIIVQEYHDPIACWIHAVLHKIEGDASNSRYWYARTSKRYEDFADAQMELKAIQQNLESAQQ